MTPFPTASPTSPGELFSRVCELEENRKAMIELNEVHLSMAFMIYIYVCVCV